MADLVQVRILVGELLEEKSKKRKEVRGQLQFPGMLAGSVYRRQRFRQCGKDSCWCSFVNPNNDGHGPYWYIEWRTVDGKKHSAYIGEEWNESKVRELLSRSRS